ncbi:MAG: exopolyphosphatase [Desulfovibrionaceae bacterium]
MSNRKFRLVTRSDFDGLISAVLFKELDMINDICFVHPKDMQDGAIVIGDGDITTNLPYNPQAHLVFDHHLSEKMRNQEGGTALPAKYILDPQAPSAARVVYEYFGGKATFPRVSDEIMEAVDKADSAQYSRDDIMHPSGWTLLNFILDPRTGLGRFHDFTISNYELMLEVIDYCRNHNIQEILALPHVRERTDLYFAHEEKAHQQLTSCTRVYNNLAVLDLRTQDVIWVANRFLLYALFPQCNLSMHVMWGFQKQNTVFAVGASILDRSSKVNIGQLLLNYGGGGHRNAGTCQISHDKAPQVMEELIAALTQA